MRAALLTCSLSVAGAVNFVLLYDVIQSTAASALLLHGNPRMRADPPRVLPQYLYVDYSQRVLSTDQTFAWSDCFVSLFFFVSVLVVVVAQLVFAQCRSEGEGRRLLQARPRSFVLGLPALQLHCRLFWFAT